MNFRVIPSHIIDINAYMLIFINKITKFRDIPGKFRKNLYSGIFRSGTFDKTITKVRAIIIPNFRVIGCVQFLRNRGAKFAPSIFTTAQPPTGAPSRIRVKKVTENQSQKYFVSEVIRCVKTVKASLCPKIKYLCHLD